MLAMRHVDRAEATQLETVSQVQRRHTALGMHTSRRAGGACLKGCRAVASIEEWKEISVKLVGEIKERASIRHGTHSVATILTLTTRGYQCRANLPASALLDSGRTSGRANGCRLLNADDSTETDARRSISGPGNAGELESTAGAVKPSRGMAKGLTQAESAEPWLGGCGLEGVAFIASGRQLTSASDGCEKSMRRSRWGGWWRC
ncbi:hypothetical protein FB45DRAFT_997134 [Roridomyces roridus]|uniref:Uncharacterized protein n=1 Tax=Roridomyces roridus TaxID=1738132 RepID=A0AAD7CII9_9AGAR|nr:hypothetical protein FB45DRAFT_997134 [Roridomyces roridus]